MEKTKVKFWAFLEYAISAQVAQLHDPVGRNAGGARLTRARQASVAVWLCAAPLFKTS
jgi:hypothetical protein